jgi:hypothetical protein
MVEKEKEYVKEVQQKKKDKLDLKAILYKKLLDKSERL